ncbi:MAG TPA: S8 family serine peptidase [Phycisphaerae bacterium]|nr:S8 family serine peptidase [Phycisphaerae bacterium]
MGYHIARVRVIAALIPLFTAALAIAQNIDDDLLYLRAATIDPHQQPSLLTTKLAPVVGGDYLIKLDGPMTPSRRKALRAAGVEPGDYVPRHAWRVTLDNADLDALRKLDFVTWLGEFAPSWKLCPGVAATKAYTTTERVSLQSAGARRLVVHLAPTAGREKVTDDLVTRSAKIRRLNAFSGASSVVIDIDASRVSGLCAIPGVRFIEEAPEATPRNASTAWIAQSNISGVTSVWDQGLHGEDQLVGVIDWDLDENHCAFADNAPFGPTHRKIQAYYGFDQNTLFGWHGTHVVDTLAGDPLDETADENLRGMAYAARIVFQDQAAIITADNLFDRLLVAHADGAHIHSNSWGATVDNSYNAWARDIDEFSFQNEDDLVIFAVINGGATTPILSPENAKNSLAVGASGDAPSQDNAGSGGTGPTTDGRRKPEVWVPACSSQSANFGTDCGVVTRSCATSWAAPATAGLAALTRQYFMEGYYPGGAASASDGFTPSGSLIKAALINSAVDMTGISGYYGQREGWGRVLLEDVLYFDGDARHLLVQDIRHDDGLSTNDTMQYVFDVLSSDAPLKITMVFADAPSSVGTSFAPVNDLDLVVTSPSGQIFLGNVFEGLESVVGGAGDTLNNNEQVHRLSPEIGTWRVDVIAREVNVAAQGFALVVTGDIVEVTAPEADLEVVFDPAGPIIAEAGDFVDVELSVINHGPDTASSLQVFCETPAGLSFAPEPLSVDCIANGTELKCSLPELAAGEEYNVTFRLRVEVTGSYLMTANVSSATADPLPDNNTAPLRIEDSASADLALTLVSAPTSLLQGESAEIQIEVRNPGPGTETAPELTITPGTGLQVDAVTPCVTTPTPSTCGIAPLAIDDAATITATIIAVGAPGKQTVRFDVVGAMDPDASNNTLVVTIVVDPDTDADGIADADDICPNGDDTIDTDADGVPDACDECPGDPNKTSIGICDCGVADTDSDGDTIPDCADLCPDDPDKIMPGDCGCGVSDEDTNENGVPDCLDTPIDSVDPEIIDEPFQFPWEGFTLDDLDPCFVRWLLQSFLGIPMCGPCISFGCVASFAGLIAMRRHSRRRRRTRR